MIFIRSLYHCMLSAPTVLSELIQMNTYNFTTAFTLFTTRVLGEPWVVERRTPEREVGGSKPTSAVLCPWARHFLKLPKSTGDTQEVVALSQHDWKVVDWDVKPQHKQNHTGAEVFQNCLQNAKNNLVPITAHLKLKNHMNRGCKQNVTC